MQHQNVLS